MPELRCGATNHRWVIVAPERGCRPSDFQQREISPCAELPEICVFCPGNEHMTPQELYRVPSVDGTHWRVRVVPNKYPALVAYDDLGREPVLGVFDRMNGVGAHEVVVETPEHSYAIPDLDLDQMMCVIETYIRRLRSLMQNPRFRYVLLFKNHGREAGASLLHPHSQIIATPVIPHEVRHSLQIARAYYKRKERCIFCDVMLAELRSGERVVDDADGFVVWAPYDSRFPFELVICPKQHSHDFTAMSERHKTGLARTLIRTTQRLRTLLGDVPYNLVLKTTPNAVQRPGKPGYWGTLQYDYHWRIEVLPRLTRVAGFEWGTGVYINPMPPESAARHVREADAERSR